MFRLIKWVVVVAVAVVVALAVAGFGYVRSTGLRARAKPAAMETHVARVVRSLAVPGRERERRNPVAQSDEAMRGALEHYADHCATCHANDGSGDTDFGRGLFPPPPDLRAAATQQLTDGELFYIIENGVRFTGMPAFGTGTAAGAEESWKLVHFIRHLPRLTTAEREAMEPLNPRSPAEIRQEIDEERFLRGDDIRPPGGVR
jgi:mono/diheme cytochrome c family protein